MLHIVLHTVYISDRCFWNGAPLKVLLCVCVCVFAWRPFCVDLSICPAAWPFHKIHASKGVHGSHGTHCRPHGTKAMRIS